MGPNQLISDKTFYDKTLKIANLEHSVMHAACMLMDE
jgi:hypothetical protein